jgi:hypothetical protein
VNKGGAIGSLNSAAGGFVGVRKLAPGSGLNCGDGAEFVLTTTRRVQRKSVGGGSGKFNGFGSGLKISGDAGGVLVLTA